MKQNEGMTGNEEDNGEWIKYMQREWWGGK